MAVPSSSDIHSLIATEYLSAVAVTVSIWDHILNIDKEVDLVWRCRGWGVLQTLVIFNLYGGQASIIFIAYVLQMGGLRPPLTHAMLASFIFIGVYGTLTTGAAQLALLLRVYSIWGSITQIKYALICGFVVCYGASVACAIVTLQEFTDKLNYSPILSSCVLPDKAYYMIGVWGGMVLYDFYVLALLVANALYKPRRRDSEIITNLNRDGALTFAVWLAALRLIELLPSIFGGAAQTFLTLVVTWALENILSFRLFLKVKAVERDAEVDWHLLTKPPLVIVEEMEMDLL